MHCRQILYHLSQQGTSSNARCRSIVFSRPKSRELEQWKKKEMAFPQPKILLPLHSHPQTNTHIWVVPIWILKLKVDTEQAAGVSLTLDFSSYYSLVHQSLAHKANGSMKCWFYIPFPFKWFSNNARSMNIQSLCCLNKSSPRPFQMWTQRPKPCGVSFSVAGWRHFSPWTCLWHIKLSNRIASEIC